jgi:hypothetical protein
VGRRRWQCAACRHQVSLTSGTVLHNTKTPLTLWFWAAYLMTTDKRGVSALLLQRQLGLRRYETAWMILHKLRRATVNFAREPLRGEVEIDDTWVGGTQAGLRGSRQLKGRRAALVLVAVEKRGRASGRLRMAVIPDFRTTTVNRFITRNIAPASLICTDGLKSFSGLQEIGFQHVPRTQPLRTEFRRGAQSVVPLADRAIGNLQQWLVGTHHGSVAVNSRPIWMSLFFDITVDGSRWQLSKRFWASALSIAPHLTTRYVALRIFHVHLLKPDYNL